MEWVWIEHPVTGGKTRIARSALADHLRCGWVETEPPEPDPVAQIKEGLEHVQATCGTPENAPSPEDVPPGEADDTAKPEKKSRRRAGNTETGE
jgi:hypothetical protein